MPATSWFDTHAHLSDPKFDADRDAAVERAFARGVPFIIEIADGPEEWDKARRLAEKYPGHVWWAAGFHPYFADQPTAALWKALGSFAAHPQFVAIGEVGLDYAKCKIPPEQQKKTFAEALDLSAEVRKPLIIHCRDAFKDLRPILRSHFKGRKNGDRETPGVIHCFAGNAEDAAECLELGFFLGVDGPLTYPSATPLREALASVPLEKLVLETDSPYLPPQTHRGQRNEPGYLPLIGQSLADFFRTSPQKTAEQLMDNSHRLFRLATSEIPPVFS